MFRREEIVDLCQSCRNFRWGDIECSKGHYISDPGVTLECDEHEEGEGIRDVFEYKEDSSDP